VVVGAQHLDRGKAGLASGGKALRHLELGEHHGNVGVESWHRDVSLSLVLDEAIIELAA